MTHPSHPALGGSKATTAPERGVGKARQMAEITDLTDEDIGRLMQDAAAKLRADSDDRRRKRGKYAPPVGICRVCGGVVTGKIEYPSDGRIGGPPRQGYVGSWSCDTCFLVYAQCPNPKAEEESHAR